MWHKNSIFSQIVLRASIFTLVFLVCAIASVYINTRNNEVIIHRHDLAGDIRDVSSYLEIESLGVKKGQLVFDLPIVARDLYAAMGINHQYSVRDLQGKVLFSSPGADVTLYPPQWPVSGEPEFFEFTGARPVKNSP